MKKVINGKIYDTATATSIGIRYNGNNERDFHYFEEVLYKTKKGQYFLCGEGHALSPWASHNGSESGWGKGIRLLSEAEAREWVEQHLDADCAMEEFQVDEG